MFLDKNESPLYIGYSINLKRRIEINHFSSDRGNLTIKCLNETYKVLYHECSSDDDMKIKERYLINELNPKYNDRLNNKNKFSFTIDIQWKLYSFNKLSLLEKRKSSIKRKRNQLKNYKTHLSINSFEEILRLDTCVFHNEENYITRNNYTGYNPWEDFYFIKINKDLYIFSVEIDEHFASRIEIDGEYIQEYNFKKIEKFCKKNDIVFIKPTDKMRLTLDENPFDYYQAKDSTIFSEFYHEDDLGFSTRNTDNKLFIKYDLFKKLNLIDKQWIKAIDNCISNLDEYLAGNYEWLLKSKV